MVANRIKVCVVGTGRAGMIHAKNFASSVPCAKVSALVDPAKDSLGKAAKELKVERCYLEFGNALKDECFDAVIVATPTEYHREIVIAASNAGKHVLCEKPMAVNKAECQDMLKAAERNKVKLQIGFMRRFDRSFIVAKRRIEQEEIGEVVLVRSVTYGPSAPKPWMYDISKSNGPLAEVNSHDIDTLRWYAGSEFKQVYAIAGNYRAPEVRKEFPDFYDNVVLGASFENGMQGVICGAQGVRYGYDSRCEILGTEGIIFVGASDGCSVTACSYDKHRARPISQSWMERFKEAYLEEDKHFIECVLEDKAPRVTGYDGMKAVEVVSAGNRSIAEHRPVEL